MNENKNAFAHVHLLLIAPVFLFFGVFFCVFKDAEHLLDLESYSLAHPFVAFFPSAHSQTVWLLRRQLRAIVRSRRWARVISPLRGAAQLHVVLCICDTEASLSEGAFPTFREIRLFACFLAESWTLVSVRQIWSRSQQLVSWKTGNRREHLDRLSVKETKSPCKHLQISLINMLFVHTLVWKFFFVFCFLQLDNATLALSLLF